MSITETTTGVTVSPETRVRWFLAMDRAQAHYTFDGPLEHRFGPRMEDGSRWLPTRRYVATFRVPSVSQVGHWYHVTLDIDHQRDPEVRVSCECRAGQTGHACKHAAAVLLDQRMMWALRPSVAVAS